MAEKPNCGICRREFQDGEFVTFFQKRDGERYHTTLDEYLVKGQRIADCGIIGVAREKTPVGGSNVVFYQGKFYSLSAVDRVAGKTRLGVVVNDNNTGHRLTGDLSGFAQETPLRLDAQHMPLPA